MELFKRQFRLDLRRYSFSQRVIDDWNSLPEDVVYSGSINQFKSRLNKLRKNKITKFEPDCYSYPLAHAKHHQTGKKTGKGPRVERLYKASTTVRQYKPMKTGSMIHEAKLKCCSYTAHVLM